MHFVRASSIMCALGVRLLLSKRFEIMEKLYTSKALLKMASGRMHSPHSIPLYPHQGHKLQKLTKKSGVFQSLGTINFVLFTKMLSQKGGMSPWPNAL